MKSELTLLWPKSTSALLCSVPCPYCNCLLPLPLFCFHFFLLSYLFPLMEAKRSQSISNCVHLYEALPTTKSVPMLLHTVSSFLPGISSGNSACSHRLSGKVFSESCMCVCVFVISASLLRPSVIVCYIQVLTALYCIESREVCISLEIMTPCVHLLENVTSFQSSLY